MTARVGSKVKTPIRVVENGRVRRRSDLVVAEEPLEIRLLAGDQQQTVAVTMRTPGHDFELAAGFLHSEGVIASREEIRSISYCVDPSVDADQRYNIVNVALTTSQMPDLATLERHFYTTSACGVCGKASLEALTLRGCPVLPTDSFQVDSAIITRLPDTLRSAQGLFDQTGGLHAAGLFDPAGNLRVLREDVGRHNAVDKVAGWALMHNQLPLHESVLLVSGRVSFEVMQKSLVAGLPVVCAISAPSHLAISVAQNFNMTLIAFLRGERFNLYAGHERIRVS